jgi:hypothetical protein
VGARGVNLALYCFILGEDNSISPSLTERDATVIDDCAALKEIRIAARNRPVDSLIRRGSTLRVNNSPAAGE